MSWIIFKDTPSYQYRGIKVKDLQYKAKPKINLSWGINQSDKISIHKQYHKNKNKKIIENDNDEEQLQKLIKQYKKQDKNKSQYQTNIPILESKWISHDRKDSVGILLDQNHINNYNLKQSRVSRRSSNGNKKNQSTFMFGDGFNHFISKQAQEKSYHQRLQDMYEYQQEYKKRNKFRIM